MDLPIILALLATTATIIGFVYGFLRNFKMDINTHIDRLEKRMDNFEARFEAREARFEAREARFEARMNSNDERMFWIMTGRSLEDAILEEKLKRPRTDP